MGDVFLGHPGTILVTGDGTIGRSGLPVRIYHMHILSGGGGGGIVQLKNGSTAGATIWVQETGTASTGATFEYHDGLLLPSGCYVDIDANVTSVAITFSTEN